MNTFIRQKAENDKNKLNIKENVVKMGERRLHRPILMLTQLNLLRTKRTNTVSSNKE
jgi:hypothetical protein